jgi:hypothetical protein
MKFSYLIYVVTDSHGNKDAVVANEPGDCVQICGMTDEDEERLYFESEAYHLDSWCVANNLNLNKIEKEAHV